MPIMMVDSGRFSKPKILRDSVVVSTFDQFFDPHQVYLVALANAGGIKNRKRGMKKLSMKELIFMSNSCL